VLDRLDRTQRAAKVNSMTTRRARGLFDKINRVAANLNVDRGRSSAGAPGSAPLEATAGKEEEKEKKRSGGRRESLKRLDSAKEMQGCAGRPARSMR
jgi:hypothetical protein